MESHGRDYYFIDESTFSRAAKSVSHFIFAASPLVLFIQGEFIQSSKRGRSMYGLTMAAIEQVAQQGLACVTHMGIKVGIALLLLCPVHEVYRGILYLYYNSHVIFTCTRSPQGVLTLKKTHFEPRYILTLPLTAEVRTTLLQS